ncbi:hypothetical protein K488DRAFT_31358, partial [Vararia minispora EC-137]
RPAMRRKSSAQNLLSSFNKAAPAPSAGQAQTPALAHYPLPPAPPPSAFPAAASTPTSRDWDAQSVHSDITGLSSAHPSSTAPLPAQASVEVLRDTVQKRIITLTYLRNVHDGSSHWFHTIAITRPDLDRAFDNASMRTRTRRFAVLAMSLAALFDVAQPADLLRALLNTLLEYEQNRDDGDRQRLRIWRRPPKNKAGGVADYAALPDATDSSYLTIPHMPFPLDYTTTLLALLDILSALYAKIARLLGPSALPHASQHMLGLAAPHPGVSYLFQQHVPASASQAEDALFDVAFPQGGAGQYSAVQQGLGSPPPSWTPAVGEMVQKVDAKFKKIIAALLKDLDQFARTEIRDELASLDPLLRNAGGPQDERERAVYEFE